MVHSRAGLARRARELGALLARLKGPLACLAFVIESDLVETPLGNLVARAARVSDIVGELRSTEFAVVAPGTDEEGAVLLAQRVCDTLQREGHLGSGAALRVGYAAVSNVGYLPTDPVALLARASAAARAGKPEPGHAWLRRYDDTTTQNSPSERIIPEPVIRESGTP